MMSDKTTWSVVAACVLTFGVAFGGLMLLGKVSEQQESASEDATKVEAGLAVGAGSDPAAATDQPSEPDDSRAAVGGRVVDSEGLPIEGAVAYFLRVQRPRASGAEESAIRTVTTDADGRFACHPRALPPKFRLMVRCRGYARWQEPYLALEGRRQVDLGEIVLSAGAPLLFSVRDADGAAVVGAEVRVRDPRDELNPELARNELAGVTDGLGVLALDGADFGQYFVTISKPGHAPFQHTYSFDTLAEDEEYSIEATLPRAEAFVTGRVTDPAGYPVHTGSVTVEPLRPPGGIETRYQGTIDDKGEFRVGPLPDGDYRVRAQAPGLLQRSASYAESDGNPVHVIIEYGGIAFGNVEVPGELEQDIAISVWSVDGVGRATPFHGSAKCVIEQESGRFEVDGLSPGRYQLRASSPPWAAARSEIFSIGAGDLRQGVDLRLSAGGSVAGRVLGARSEPLTGVRVTAFEGPMAPPPALVPLFDRSALASTQTDATGTFHLQRLSPGSHVLLLEAAGLPVRTVGPLEVLADGEIQLGRVGLGSGGSISGSVEGPAGDRLVGARVILQSDETEVWMIMQTDVEGNYCAQGLAAGSYRLRVEQGAWSGPDASPVMQTVALGDGEHLRRALRLH